MKFVIIGGMAARLHDTGHTTIDVDICPSPDNANLSRLSYGLRELDARLRVDGDPDGVPFEPHPTMLRDMAMMTLITEEGPLDLCFAPAGRHGGFLGPGFLAQPHSLISVPCASGPQGVHIRSVPGRLELRVSAAWRSRPSQRWP